MRQSTIGIFGADFATAGAASEQKAPEDTALDDKVCLPPPIHTPYSPIHVFFERCSVCVGGARLGVWGDVLVVCVCLCRGWCSLSVCVCV